MAYAIYRAKKIKTTAKLTQTSRHNVRIEQPSHADPHGEIRILHGSADPAADVQALLPDRRRKDAVIAMELLVGASPEYFRPDEPEVWGLYDAGRMKAWETRAMQWLHDEFGDNLVNAVLHLDESTPHIQALVVPLDREVGRLAAKRLFGPETLKQQQDSYAAIMADIGLKRGQPGSRAKHEPLRKYYARLGKPTPAPPKPTRTVEKPKPSVWERVAERLGIRTDYTQRTNAWEIQEETNRNARREYIQTLAAKAAELGDGEWAARQGRAVRRLVHRIEEEKGQDPEAVKRAWEKLAPEEKAEIEAALEELEEEGPGPR